MVGWLTATIPRSFCGRKVADKLGRGECHTSIVANSSSGPIQEFFTNFQLVIHLSYIVIVLVLTNNLAYNCIVTLRISIMSIESQAQLDAINNANADTNYLQPAGTAITETVTTATAFQVSTTRSAMLYINITTAAALAIAMGSTSSTSITVAASESETLGVTTLKVPAGWYVKLTGTMADIVVVAVLE